MKRFYKDVTVTAEAGGFGVALDSRPVRTPLRRALLLPTRALAEAIAAEWEAQQGDVRPSSMPLTGLANAAIDRVAPDVAGFAEPLAAYVEGDALAYRATDPPSLVAAERAAWDPLLAWARDGLGLEMTLSTGVTPLRQGRATVARVRGMLAALDAFRLVALDPVIRIGGSAIVGLALLHGRIGAEEAFAATHVEELWQASQWGDDALAVAARADRRQAMLAAARFLALCG
ncbi:ATP12 family chaperone protein [Sandaracinobacteroides saxicola]|uniref:ATPase n=1 Tax=Sandaracinobacteroides saxicola TaxID=2759707 RepID=A0A7G5IFN0_9SPHN|nr:ATP12 family protein [Sandaracinobacteroides saxicola]QMW22172.1 ATPase [Sandaracinobacteroides saxicola]